MVDTFDDVDVPHNTAPVRLRQEAVPRVAPSGRRVVVGSGLGANQLVVFVNAMNEMGKIFESPVKLEKKAFKFEPMLLAA
jgi:hypothetical protein